LSRNLDKKPFTAETAIIKQGLPLKKKTLITTVFISVLLLSALAGTQVVNFVFAQSPEIITIKADGSINPSPPPTVPEMTLLAAVIALATVTCVIFAVKRKSPQRLAIVYSTKISMGQDKS